MNRSFLFGTLSMMTWMGLAALGQQPGTKTPPTVRQLPAAPAQNAGTQGADQGVDFRHLPVERIPIGTIIGQQQPPPGWTNLVIFAVPTLTPEDLRDAPQIAADYARMFKFTILANVVAQRNGASVSYSLDKVARGFAVNINGKETIVSGQNTLGASLGLFGKRILDENEKCLDEDLRQVLRTKTMLILDGNAVMLRNNEHVKMVVRHALVVEPSTGRLYSLVWLLDKNYQAAEGVVQLLPPAMHEQRLLSVKRDKFNKLGIPTREAFALRRIPQGTPIAYNPRLQWAATQKTFAPQYVAELETILRTEAVQAAVKR